MSILAIWLLSHLASTYTRKAALSKESFPDGTSPRQRKDDFLVLAPPPTLGILLGKKPLPKVSRRSLVKRFVAFKEAVNKEPREREPSWRYDDEKMSFGNQERPYESDMVSQEYDYPRLESREIHETKMREPQICQKPAQHYTDQIRIVSVEIQKPEPRYEFGPSFESEKRTEQSSTPEPRSKPNFEPGTDLGTRSEPKLEPRTDSGSRPEPKFEPRTNSGSRSQPKSEPRTEQSLTPEPNFEPRTEQSSTLEPRLEPKSEPENEDGEHQDEEGDEEDEDEEDEDPKSKPAQKPRSEDPKSKPAQKPKPAQKQKPVKEPRPLIEFTSTSQTSSVQSTTITNVFVGEVNIVGNGSRVQIPVTTSSKEGEEPHSPRQASAQPSLQQSSIPPSLQQFTVPPSSQQFSAPLEPRQLAAPLSPKQTTVSFQLKPLSSTHLSGPISNPLSPKQGQASGSFQFTPLSVPTLSTLSSPVSAPVVNSKVVQPLEKQQDSIERPVTGVSQPSFVPVFSSTQVSLSDEHNPNLLTLSQLKLDEEPGSNSSLITLSHNSKQEPVVKDDEKERMLKEGGGFGAIGTAPAIKIIEGPGDLVKHSRSFTRGDFTLTVKSEHADQYPTILTSLFFKLSLAKLTDDAVKKINVNFKDVIPKENEEQEVLIGAKIGKKGSIQTDKDGYLYFNIIKKSFDKRKESKKVRYLLQAE